MDNQQDAELSILGIGKLLRRNLVVGIIVIQFMAIVGLGKVILNFHDEMIKIKEQSKEEIKQSYENLIEHIDRKTTSVNLSIDTVIRKVQVTDSLSKNLLQKQR